MTTPKAIYDSLTESLGVAPSETEDGKELTVSPYERVEVPSANEFEGKGEIKEGHVADDYAFSRAHLQTVIESGQTALQTALEVAAATGNPEIFASVAALMRETAQSVKALAELQEQLKKLDLAKAKIAQTSAQRGQNGQAPGSQTNNFFIGSTKELLEMIHGAMRDSQISVIEGEAVEVHSDPA